MYKTCSVNKVIAKFYRDFKPSNSGWNEDAIEWIGEAISIMRVGQGFRNTFKKLNVIDYRTKIPCEIEVMLGVEHNGFKLPKNGGVNFFKHCDELNSLPLCKVNSYSLNPNYIETSFKTGCIVVYYYGIPVDCDGYPEIIDDVLYEQALVWYILMKLIGRGFKHQMFNNYQDLELKWEKACAKAQNRFRGKDLGEMETFSKSWLGLVNKTNLDKKFFNSIDYSINEKAYPPGTLIETFPFLGDNLNNV